MLVFINSFSFAKESVSKFHIYYYTKYLSNNTHVFIMIYISHTICKFVPQKNLIKGGIHKLQSLKYFLFYIFFKINLRNKFSTIAL